MVLEEYIRKERERKELLLMTHLVLGYPSFDESAKLVEAMVSAGVELIELQIPFSEPMADGPVILAANHKALEQGATVEKCFEVAESLAQRFDVPFLFMTYYNIPFRFGVRAFAQRSAQVGVKGIIVPDLPPEEAGEYLEASASSGLAPIFIYSPNTPEARLRQIADCGQGFVYCVARKGVTGAHTDFTVSLEEYLQRCRRATGLPLALGFGVQGKDDVDFLRGKVDIAVIGSQTLRLMEHGGMTAVGPFLQSLR